MPPATTWFLSAYFEVDRCSSTRRGGSSAREISPTLDCRRTSSGSDSPTVGTTVSTRSTMSGRTTCTGRSTWRGWGRSSTIPDASTTIGTTCPPACRPLSRGGNVTFLVFIHAIFWYIPIILRLQKPNFIPNNLINMLNSSKKLNNSKIECCVSRRSFFDFSCGNTT